MEHAQALADDAEPRRWRLEKSSSSCCGLPSYWLRLAITDQGAEFRALACVVCLQLTRCTLRGSLGRFLSGRGQYAFRPITTGARCPECGDARLVGTLRLNDTERVEIHLCIQCATSLRRRRRVIPVPQAEFIESIFRSRRWS